jgi:DNA adenine methylase
VKYNEKIFSWDDQIRLRDAVVRATERGAKAVVTNAHHSSILELYEGIGTSIALGRHSKISGQSSGRQKTQELVVVIQ